MCRLTRGGGGGAARLPRLCPQARPEAAGQGVGHGQCGRLPHLDAQRPGPGGQEGGIDTSWTNNTDDTFKKREGGSPGFIIHSSLSPATGSSVGVFKGHTGNIPGLIGDDGLTI